MALLSENLIREIIEVAQTYAVSEKVRLAKLAKDQARKEKAPSEPEGLLGIRGLNAGSFGTPTTSFLARMGGVRTDSAAVKARE